MVRFGIFYCSFLVLCNPKHFVGARKNLVRSSNSIDVQEEGTLFTNAANTGEDEILIIQDLGRRMRLGEFYDARTNTIIPGRLLDISKIGDYVYNTTGSFTSIDFSFENKFSDRMNLLNLGVDAKFEMLTEKFNLNVDGSFKYLKDKKESFNSVKYAGRFLTRTFRETIDVLNNETLAGINRKIFEADSKLATHFVSSITWGSNVIFSFENIASDSQDKKNIEAGLRGILELEDQNIKASVDGNFNKQDFEKEVNSNTRVVIFGDIKIKEKIPTTPKDTLDFIRRLPELSDKVVGDGVPMEISLTPLSWVDSQAARFERKIKDDILGRVLLIYDELEQSEGRIKDLTKLQFDGFNKWKFDVDEYHRRFLNYQAEFSLKMRNEAKNFIQTGNVKTLVSIENEYYDLTNTFYFQSVIEECESREDELKTLLALSSQFSRSSIVFVEHLGDFYAPTFDITYDYVYGLVIVGSQATSDKYEPTRFNRDGMSKIRDFVTFASAHKCENGNCKDKNEDKIDTKIKHCLFKESTKKNICVKTEAFVAIHYNSFDTSLCRDEVHNFRIASATTGEYSSGLPVPFAKEWCEEPTTEIMRFSRSEEVVNFSKNIPKTPDKVVIGDVTNELTNNAKKDKFKVNLSNISNNTRILNFVLKYSEPIIDDNDNIDFEFKEISTRFLHKSNNSTDTFTLNFLLASQTYNLFVAAENELGEGPLSDSKVIESKKPIVINKLGINIKGHETTKLTEFPTAGIEVEVVFELTAANSNLIGKAKLEILDPKKSFPCQLKEKSFKEGTCVLSIDNGKLNNFNINEGNFTIYDEEDVVIARQEKNINKIEDGKSCGKVDKTFYYCKQTQKCDFDCKNCEDNTVENSTRNTCEKPTPAPTSAPSSVPSSAPSS